MNIPDNKTDGCCNECDAKCCRSTISHHCEKQYCRCHQSPQTSHDLIEDAVSRLIRLENRVLASVIRGEDPTDSFEEVLRKTLESIVEKIREEEMKKKVWDMAVPAEFAKRLHEAGKAEGRKEALDEIEKKVGENKAEREHGDEVIMAWEQGEIQEKGRVLSILSDIRKK